MKKEILFQLDIAWQLFEWEREDRRENVKYAGHVVILRPDPGKDG